MFGPLNFRENVVLDLNTFIFSSFLLIAGIQLMTFGVLSRTYAAVTGILPMNGWATALVHHATVNSIVALSALPFLCGVGLFGYALSLWGEQSFGPLTDPHIPRMITTSGALIVIGLQTFFSGLLLGVLGIPLRKL